MMYKFHEDMHGEVISSKCRCHYVRERTHMCKHVAAQKIDAMMSGQQHVPALRFLARFYANVTEYQYMD